MRLKTLKRLGKIRSYNTEEAEVTSQGRRSQITEVTKSNLFMSIRPKKIKFIRLK